MHFISLAIAPPRNEFVEKALRQYCGRLHAERSVAYLPRALQEMLEGTLACSATGWVSCCSSWWWSTT